ncbi:MAG TPA: hypothetical protein VN381_01730 [Anaerovoracaceae bacterium]|nr:hypothetical protein [Anaerovoracaceae bacterium]
MYSKEDIHTALELYHQCGSVAKTLQLLGYPSKGALYGWIDDEGTLKRPRKVRKIINTQAHPHSGWFLVSHALRAQQAKKPKIIRKIRRRGRGSSL